MNKTGFPQTLKVLKSPVEKVLDAHDFAHEPGHRGSYKNVLENRPGRIGPGGAWCLRPGTFVVLPDATHRNLKSVHHGLEFFNR